MSTVDVVIPCYNYARFLRACVGSVLSQSGVDVRVLVIDDASSDETPQVCRELAALNKRVEFRRHDANKGHIATYNEGLIGWAAGTYVVLLSADDMLAPGALGRAVGIMDDDEKIGMVYGRAVHFSREAELTKLSLNPSHNEVYTRFSGADWLEGRFRAGYNVISSPEVVVRGSIQRTIGGYRPELPHSGDLEMWLRIAAVSNIAYVRGSPQAFYRVHSASMLRTRYRNSLVDLRQRKAAFDAFFREYQHVVGVGHLLDLANRALAREALWDACRAYDHNKVEETGAQDLVDFALATYCSATSLSEYAALCRRRRFGPTICNRTQIFAAPALVRRIRNSVRQQRWKRRGI